MENDTYDTFLTKSKLESSMFSMCVYTHIDKEKCSG